MSESDVDPEGWRHEVIEDRNEKDRFLGERRHSPVPEQRREAFDGLDYYDPDPAYRVEATVEAHDDPEHLEMETTTDERRTYAHVVTLRFELGGVERTLAGYRRVDRDEPGLLTRALKWLYARATGLDALLEDDEPGLFVPFRDATSGEETYGAGRYLELDVDPPYADGQRVVVDFNRASAPYCAFNDELSCPLPPRENWLDVEVRAGERYDPGAAYAADD